MHIYIHTKADVKIKNLKPKYVLTNQLHIGLKVMTITAKHKRLVRIHTWQSSDHVFQYELGYYY